MTTSCPTCGQPMPDQPRRDPPLAPLEFSPEPNGDFDELIARFADGLVHAEMMSNSGLYIGFYWDDCRYCQVWINSKKRLHIYHEDGEGDPPRYTAQGVDRRPDLPDYGSTPRDVVDGREGGR